MMKVFISMMVILALIIAFMFGYYLYMTKTMSQMSSMLDEIIVDVNNENWELGLTEIAELKDFWNPRHFWFDIMSDRTLIDSINNLIVRSEQFIIHRDKQIFPELAELKNVIETIQHKSCLSIENIF